MECNFIGFHDRWLFGTPKYVASASLTFSSCFITLFSTGGPRSALGSAVACGILLGVFEGVGVLMSRVFSEGSRPQMAPSVYLIPFQNVFLLSSYKQYPELHHLELHPLLWEHSRHFIYLSPLLTPGPTCQP